MCCKYTEINRLIVSSFTYLSIPRIQTQPEYILFTFFQLSNTTSKGLPTVGATVNDHDYKDSGTLEPRLVSPRKETDLHLLDAHDVWRVIRKEAERAGNLDMVQRLHSALACPVTYKANKCPRSEGISIQIIKSSGKRFLHLGWVPPVPVIS